MTRGAFIFSTLARAQYAALARMRLQMLGNSLRTKQGSFELAARIIRSGFFLLVGLLIGLGLGFAAFEMAENDGLRLLPVLFWPVMLLWQFVPVMTAAIQGPVDMSILLRFPVSFGSYVLDYLIYGLFDTSSILGGIALAGIWMGLICALPGKIACITLAVVLFAAFNLLLTRMIFAWLDRWLAQRKTREVLGMVFLFLLLGAQLLNPALYGNSGRHSGHRGPPSRESVAKLQRAALTAEKAQRLLPPGLAAAAIGEVKQGRGAMASASLGGLALYALAAGSLLGLRLRAQYRGENLGEAPQRAAKAEGARKGHKAFDLAGPIGYGPIGAVVEKELRYLARSGVMLYGMLAPLIMLFVLGRNGTGAGFAARYGLPLGVAYGFLGITRLVYNSLGGEGPGIQLYFMSPTPLRTVMLAKNLVQIALFALELAIVSVIIVFRFGLPDGEMLAATVCWLLFALPAQLAAGNVLSITMAYRMTLTRMSQEQGAAGNGLLSLLIQLLIFAVGAAVFLPLSHFGHARLAAPVFLLMAIGSAVAWLRVLANADGMAQQRRESLIGSLARAS